MGDQRDGMLKLMEKLKENGVEMSFGPRTMSDRDDISVIFRKWSDNKNMPYCKRQRLVSLDELRNLNISVEDLLIDMLDKFIKEFKKEEDKYFDR